MGQRSMQLNTTRRRSCKFVDPERLRVFDLFISCLNILTVRPAGESFHCNRQFELHIRKCKKKGVFAQSDARTKSNIHQLDFMIEWP